MDSCVAFEVDGADNLCVTTFQTHVETEESYPEPNEERCTNLRQSMIGVLKTQRKQHCTYVPTAWNLGLAYVELRPWNKIQQEVLDLVSSGVGTTFTARMALNYRDGEARILASELEHEHGSPNQLSDKLIPLPSPDATTLAVSPAENVCGLNDTYLEEVGSNCPSLEVFCLSFNQYQPLPTAIFRIIDSCPKLRVLELAGQAYAVNDAVLQALATKCKELEILSFGQDNSELEPLLVTASALSHVANSCPSLRIVRMLHSCLDGDPTDKGSEVALALSRRGFSLKFAPDAKHIRKTMQNNSFHFWRADCEEGLMSAAWYERNVYRG
ncbi:hypothetical protein CYMTET_22808 [Cymbomonas tetramitiformis]|uniref:Uncharacterized protein n=1 Tax=Cymbomonas tetramitiformis TaxID=36881 RepID=A0AAE0L1U5_9CHLO|nr:hypothetical protein CYMTET_22808 [Cymbomonas tetramitiformis]|eukprot:gene1461-2084_t